MILFWGMQQDDTQMNEFIAQVKSHVESHQQFVHQVSEALTHLIEAMAVKDAQQTRSTPAPKKTPAVSKFEDSISNSVQKRILVVDDAEINRVLMGHFFRSLPVILEFANSGEQAMEKIVDDTFDLILMDLQMKGMSGLDSIKAIRSAQPENLKRTQIIAISNVNPTDEERDQTISAGANEYLSKSMSREAIKEKVLECLFGASQISA